jgi:xanthine dehydrogenase accessory factor
MLDRLDRTILPLPQAVAGNPDDCAALFRLLSQSHDQDLDAALLTVIATSGSSRRPIGTQMAVLQDGRYFGYLSGGCVEAAAATEAMMLMTRGESGLLHFGKGSPFADIALPCGGAFHIRVDTAVPAELIVRCLERFSARTPFALDFDDGVAWGDGPARGYRRHYRPETRLVLIGDDPALDVLARMGEAAGWQTFTPRSPEEVDKLCDPFTAIVVADHDHEREVHILLSLVHASKFYIGAVGSEATHARRLEILKQRGVPEHLRQSIRGPVGSFGPCKDASSLAVSILSEITQARATTDAAEQHKNYFLT